ncbi:MAG: hypothetical protein KAQ92_06290, partial [Candidatus Aenigmarchaeota archaeon]|nr:hypothetical protein [Candidatus Aenigmarchaeota archaeon]
KFIILSCLIFASIVVFGNITISDFSCEQISTSSINNVTKAGATSLYNFSINVDSNFTSLNLTIPSAFAYIENSTNNTLYPNWTCSNYTQSKIKCSCDDCNVSINATDSIYLWLNLTSPDYSNETIFNFTVFVYLNQTNNATQNTTIGNDGNITFIGTVIGVENETIIEKGNIPVDVYNILDSFAGINLSASDSVQLILRNYGNGNTNKTYNMSSITANGNTQSNNFSASIYTGNLEDGAYNISIYAKDTLGNYRYSNTSYYFNVTAQPDLIIDSLNWTSVYGDNCPYSTYEGNYTNFTINLSIKNNGTADLVNTTTILFEWDSLLITQNITSLSVGSSTMLNYTIKGCPLNVSYGVHTITANLDSYSNQTEKDESNTLYTEFLYIGYNVTVLNISHSVVAPGENITVSVKVLYGNGSAVDDLSDTDDFKIYDKWNSGSFIYFN